MTKIPKTTPGPELRLIGRTQTIVGLLLAALLLINVDCGGGSGISQGTGGGTGVNTGVGGSGGGVVPCGGPGQACCGGNSCTGGGCCIASTAAGGGAATRQCVGSGQACTGAGVSGLCSNGSCSTATGTPCGALAQACCPGGAAAALLISVPPAVPAVLVARAPRAVGPRRPAVRAQPPTSVRRACSASQSLAAATSAARAEAPASRAVPTTLATADSAATTRRAPTRPGPARLAARPGRHAVSGTTVRVDWHAAGSPPAAPAPAAHAVDSVRSAAPATPASKAAARPGLAPTSAPSVVRPGSPAVEPATLVPATPGLLARLGPVPVGFRGCAPPVAAPARPVARSSLRATVGRDRPRAEPRCRA